MERRSFLAAGIASAGAIFGCRSTGTLDLSSLPLPPGAVVPLGTTRRLIVERTDPLSGRCRYVAEADGRRVAHPIFVARRGDRFDGVVENTLPQPTTVHFHGLTLPEAQDGAGFDAIAPGERRTLSFEVRNRSGLYWFHAHPHGFTAEQVHAGLAGLLIVIDEDDAALDRALAVGSRHALMLSDRRVAGDLQLPYAASAEECLHGWFGNRAMVNGALDARLAVVPGWTRLQLLNACNARGLLLAFRDTAAAADSSNLPFHLLGTDGGLLATPVALDRVFLYPAERVDVAIDVSGRREIAAVSLAFDPRHQVKGGILQHPHRARGRYPSLAAETVCADGRPPPASMLPDGAELPLFTLVGSGEKVTVPALPSRLSALPEAAAQTDAPSRSLRLDFDDKTGFLIDGKPYSLDEIAFSVQRGAREVWEVRNSPISMPHPMHLHGFGFRVLRRRGTFGSARALATESAGRLPTDLGVKDTVVIWPNETVWLTADFSLPADAAFDGRQRYMFHCHNLEHEDGMMMRNFAVV